MLFKEFFNITISIFFCKGRNSPCLKYILFSKQFFTISMDFFLIFSREIQIYIWYFISVKSHEYLKWYCMPFSNCWTSAFFTYFFWKVNPSSFSFDKLYVETIFVLTNIMRIKCINFCNSHHVSY